MSSKKQSHRKDELNEQSETKHIDSQSLNTEESLVEDINDATNATDNVSGDLEQKYADLNDKNLRLMAEFDNYRKRTLKEKADIIKNAGERIFVDMLPLIDDFERAVQAMNATDDITAVKEGVELIYNKFVGFLQSHGVRPIPTENETFDVDLHEAVTTFPVQSDEQKGKIIDCLSKGYLLNDKVIRFPKVVVGE